MASADATKPEEKQEEKPTSGNANGEEPEKEVVFQAPECPVEKVTVYPDRAEVCRRVDASLAQGLNQVVMKKLPNMVYSDSIRVEGKGAATITEVVFHTECVPKGEGDISAQEKQLVEEREDLEEQRTVLQSELSVLRKQWSLLDGFATTASKGGADTAKDKDGDKASGSLQLTEPFFKGLTDFLQLYSTQGTALERRQLELQKKLDAVSKKIDANTMNHNKLKRDRDSVDEIRKCIIMVECKESCKVSLLVSYVTANAAWKPSYDIRMYSAEEMLKITYYGQIRQSTGEDWVDAKLFLSTAMPSIGGEIPELQTAELSLYKPRPKYKGFGAAGFSMGRANRGASFRRSRAEEDAMLQCGLSLDLAPAALPRVSHAEAEVQ